VTDLFQHWDQRYQTGSTPWESGRPSRELMRIVREQPIAPGRVLEPGCGTGVNAVWLAEQGFQVTAVDCSALAIEQATERATKAGVTIRFEVRNVCDLTAPDGPYPFVFDRGCFHTVRRTERERYLRMLERVTGPGSLFLLLAGNANEPRTSGPPGLSEADLRTDLEPQFEFLSLTEFRFEDVDGPNGPLAWNAVLRRRSFL
jgi:ubiquinone/menaquinone biosynthesis C-methylase UbiE